jgi:hypothetical protein
MANNNPLLLDRLTPTVLGAIWIGDTFLDISTPGFTELNYIFDGLLSQSIHLYSEEQKNEPLSFFTKNFGENFFLYYLNGKVKFPMTLPMAPSENRNTILIINSSLVKKIHLEDFEKNLLGYQFELLEVTA